MIETVFFIVNKNLSQNYFCHQRVGSLFIEKELSSMSRFFTKIRITAKGNNHTILAWYLSQGKFNFISVAGDNKF